MATAHLVNVEEYLHSTFKPDAEYVAGRIIQRFLPQKPHSEMQTFLARMLCEAGRPPGYEIWVKQRAERIQDGVFRTGAIELDLRSIQ